MKISTILNENRAISTLVFPALRLFHWLSNFFLYQSRGFHLLGDKPSRLYIPYNCIPENNLYGHSEVIGSIIGRKLIKRVHIQHGVIFGNLVQEIMIKSHAKTILTFSEERKKIIEKKTDKRVIAIGPYITYAKVRLSAHEFSSTKANFGKTLLVFPAHSPVNRGTVHFDHEKFIQEILRIKKLHNVNTVLVCLYFTDLSSDVMTFYEQFGFKVCSAGYWLSPNFLNNLRTLIELSDLTISNKVGTHVGYCVSLGKPHFIYKQQNTIKFNVSETGNTEKVQYDANFANSQVDIIKIEEAFSEDIFSITDRQIKVIKEFWGENAYSEKDLRTLLEPK